MALTGPPPVAYRGHMAGLAVQAVVAIHLGYLLYVLLGGFLGLRNIHWLWPHLVTAFWGVFGALTKIACPLTVLEKDLLARSGSEPYDGTFIAYHVAGVYYPAGWQAGVWYATALLVLASYALSVSHHTATRLTSRTAAGDPRGSRPWTARR